MKVTYRSLLLTSLLLLSGCARCDRNAPSDPEEHKAAVQDDKVKDVKDLNEQAIKLIREEKYAEAAKLLKQAQKKIEEDKTKRNDGSAEEQTKQNLAIVDGILKPRDLANVVAPPKPEDPPAPLGKADLLRYYPVGREIKSATVLTIKGKGTDAAWSLKKERNFVYLYQVLVSTKVLANDSKKVSFEVYCPEVSHVLVHSDQTLELLPPEGIFATLLWKAVEHGLLNNVPFYSAAKSAIALADPQLKTTLTFIAEQLRVGRGKLDANADANADIGVISKIDSLSGARLLVDYVDGIGVTSLTVQGGGKLEKEILLGVAENSGLLLDYYVFPGANKKVSDQWSVRAREVASLIPLGHDALLTGKLELRRDEDFKDGKTKLRVLPSTLDAVGRGKDRGDTVRVNVKGGQLHYFKEGLLVESGIIELGGAVAFRSKNSLLFRTESLRDLDVTARYSAELVDPGANAKKGN